MAPRSFLIIFRLLVMVYAARCNLINRILSCQMMWIGNGIMEFQVVWIGFNYKLTWWLHSLVNSSYPLQSIAMCIHDVLVSTTLILFKFSYKWSLIATPTPLISFPMLRLTTYCSWDVIKIYSSSCQDSRHYIGIASNKTVQSWGGLFFRSFFI